MSETIAVRKEFILEGYNAACDAWKERLRNELPELFAKPSVEQLIRNAGLEKVYFDYKVTILKDSVLIPMPNANDEWTFNAFDLCKKICELLNQNGITAYPVHGESYTSGYKAEGSKNFIRIKLA